MLHQKQNFTNCLRVIVFAKFGLRDLTTGNHLTVTCQINVVGFAATIKFKPNIFKNNVKVIEKFSSIYKCSLFILLIRTANKHMIRVVSSAKC